MKRSDSFLLVLLAALWGGSYLFLRLGAAEFGAVPLAAVRAGVAAAILVGWVAARGGARDLIRHWRPVAVVGGLNSALPFVLFAFAAQRLPAGVLSLLTALTPLSTLAIAVGCYGERLEVRRLGGFVAGVAGVAWVVAGEAGGGRPDGATALAVGAGLLATLLYGVASNFAKHRLASVPPVAVAAGSQVAAAVLLVPVAIGRWPAVAPSAGAWAAVLGLAVASTALAYAVFFRLIARVGAPRTTTVTFLIPIFGVLWGRLFLGEPVTGSMILGGAVILLGTAWATGAIALPRQRWQATTEAGWLAVIAHK